MKDKRIYGMFGPKIKAMRLEQGLKQRQLAELLETDMPMYSKMELGARRVRRDQVPKLAELYKVDERELMKLWLADGVYAILKEEDETLMMECSQNPIGFKQLVFAVAQDCENLLKMVSNPNRLFSHCFRKMENQQLEFFLSC